MAERRTGLSGGAIAEFAVPVCHWQPSPAATAAVTDELKAACLNGTDEVGPKMAVDRPGRAGGRGSLTLNERFPSFPSSSLSDVFEFVTQLHRNHQLLLMVPASATISHI
jgi:hypothetical protein